MWQVATEADKLVNEEIIVIKHKLQRTAYLKLQVLLLRTQYSNTLLCSQSPADAVIHFRLHQSPWKFQTNNRIFEKKDNLNLHCK